MDWFPAIMAVEQARTCAAGPPMATNFTQIAVSPNFTAAKLQNPTIDDKIDVFEDQVYGWVLNHAKVLASSRNPERRHCGIAVLMLAGSYFDLLRHS